MTGMTGAPDLYPASPLRPRPGLPIGRVIAAETDHPTRPAFYEWELRAEEWSDEHPHDEYVFVLEGELHVTSGGVTVIAPTGALVRVPGGVRGVYAAPAHARILTVYGPRPQQPSDHRGVLRPIPTEE